MNILCLDDEKMGLEALMDSIKEVEPDATIYSFSSGEEVVDFVKDGTNIDVAFLDINLRGMNGILVAQKSKLINPKINIVFATGYDNYLSDAFQLHASGYIMKPITADKVRVELENLRTPVVDDVATLAAPTEGPKNNVEIRIKTFGNFEIFANGKPIRFKYDRTKEMIAYMIDRQGALCSNGEIIANLWEDDGNHSSYLRGLRKDLVDTLGGLGRMDVVNQQRGKIGIDTEAVICDYYEFLAGDPKAINMYQGEYMSQYSWGEFTNAALDVNSFRE